ncbi:hypothetical protein GALL_475230 [mine drainage metagenome]|uniref:Uncharacterized protein n=1 Tax=mine drainage metagenome TaxID=410659 RepID=A0A1J5PHD2_9ZZZZ
MQHAAQRLHPVLVGGAQPCPGEYSLGLQLQRLALLLAAGQRQRAPQHIGRVELDGKALVTEIHRASHSAEERQAGAPHHVHPLQAGPALDRGGPHVVQREFERDVQPDRSAGAHRIEHIAQPLVDRAVDEVAERVGCLRLRLAADAQHTVAKAGQGAVDCGEARAVGMRRGVADFQTVGGDDEFAGHLGQLRPQGVGMHGLGTCRFALGKQLPRRVVEHPIVDLRGHAEGAATGGLVVGKVGHFSLDREIHLFRAACGNAAAQVITGLQRNVHRQVVPHRAGVGAGELALEIDASQPLRGAAPVQGGGARGVGIGEGEFLAVDAPGAVAAALPAQVGLQAVERQLRRREHQRQVQATLGESQLHAAIVLRGGQVARQPLQSGQIGGQIQRLGCGRACGDQGLDVFRRSGLLPPRAGGAAPGQAGEPGLQAVSRRQSACGRSRRPLPSGFQAGDAALRL